VSNPNLFISYSWSNPDHEEWVLDLATELRDSGINVILDKWDLKEGNDANAFMEQMVSKPEIEKVLLICDEKYVQKTNDRSGGVGTEAQIISSEIYSKQDQDKFVAVVKERDDNGDAYLPTYYKSRIYIDMSDQSTNVKNFEKLLRWIYDKPLHQKPELGDKPKFLDENNNSVSLGTSVVFKRASNALKNDKDYASAALEEYFSKLSSEIEKLRLSGDEKPFDEAVIESIESFIPYRNQAIEIFLTIALYNDCDENRVRIHRFFEKLLPYLSKTNNTNRYKEGDFDNFRFIIHELFLYAVAALVKYERFDSANYLMQNEYYISGHPEFGGNNLASYSEFRRYMRSLEDRNNRLKKNRLSIRADLLKNRCKETGIEFRYLMQADLILYLRHQIDYQEVYHDWWPETLLYASHFSGPFEIFARSRSSKYFDNVKVLLGVESKNELEKLWKEFETGKRKIPRWQFDSFSPKNLIGYDELCRKT
jgi:hypothetical protein|tara:strand:- start:92 stop:1531 length:1440 start_codon:yes stop_codon:yes gene_type:complete